VIHFSIRHIEIFTGYT